MRKQRTSRLFPDEVNIMEAIEKTYAIGAALKEQIKTINKLIQRIKYGQKKFETTEQTLIELTLLHLILYEKHIIEMIERGLDKFDKSSLERVSTSSCVKLSSPLNKLYDYGIRHIK